MLERILYAIVIFAFGLLLGAATYDQEAMPRLVRAAYNKGYEDGKLRTDWKQVALSDPDYSRHICHAWWFKANGTERDVRPKVTK